MQIAHGRPVTRHWIADRLSPYSAATTDASAADQACTAAHGDERFTHASLQRILGPGRRLRVARQGRTHPTHRPLRPAHRVLDPRHPGWVPPRPPCRTGRTDAPHRRPGRRRRGAAPVGGAHQGLPAGRQGRGARARRRAARHARRERRRERPHPGRRHAAPHADAAARLVRGRRGRCQPAGARGVLGAAVRRVHAPSQRAGPGRRRLPDRLGDGARHGHRGRRALAPGRHARGAGGAEAVPVRCRRRFSRAKPESTPPARRRLTAARTSAAAPRAA